VERIVIIGGNAAGMTAASRARRLNANLDLTVVESGPYAAYSICGAPYLVSGVVGNAEALVPFTPQEFFRQRGVEVRVQTEALSIHPGLKRIDLRCCNTGRRETLAYDRLLLATGYLPLVPRLSGIDHPRVFTLSRLESAAALHALAKEGQLRRVLLLGGGYISLQLCEALLPFSCRMTLVEAGDAILGYLDRDMSEIVAQELKIQGLQVLFGATLGELRQARDGPGVSALIQPGGYWNTYDAVLIDIGMTPNVELAVRAGVRLGRSGAIEVTDRMETSIFGIYAAGNCAEAMHLVVGRPQANFLATVAQKQGRAAGENLAGQIGRFHGHVGTSILKVFGLSIGSTGLSTREALQCGFRADAVKISAPVCAEYLPDSVHLTLKVVFDRDNGRLLGAQAIGMRGVAGKIDVLAACLQRRQTIDEAAQLDLAYAPSLSQVWDPIHVAMHAAQRAIRQGAR
jgi:CoA-dependent NAD(P)H sulfur oxidoreductase